MRRGRGGVAVEVALRVVLRICDRWKVEHGVTEAVAGDRPATPEASTKQHPQRVRVL